MKDFFVFILETYTDNDKQLNRTPKMSEPQIIGLKTEISRQAGLKRFEASIGDHTLQCLVMAWQSMPKDKLLEALIWNYVKGLPTALYVNKDSNELGIKSTIKGYTNKKGITTLAHFTQNGKYLGSVKQLGEQPIGYTGYFKVEDNLFDLDLNGLNNIQWLNGEANWSSLFKAKTTPVVEEEEEVLEDVPVPPVKIKIVPRRKIVRT